MSKKEQPPAPKGEYPVGYRKPPMATRFQPGRSGNPRGRTKGRKNLSTLFSEELAKHIVLTENGERKKISKQQALIKQVINKALSNDSKALALVLDQIRRDEASISAPAADATDRVEDALVIKNITERIRRNEPLSSGADSDEKAPGATE